MARNGSGFCTVHLENAFGVPVRVGKKIGGVGCKTERIKCPASEIILIAEQRITLRNLPRIWPTEWLGPEYVLGHKLPQIEQRGGCRSSARHSCKPPTRSLPHLPCTASSIAARLLSITDAAALRRQCYNHTLQVLADAVGPAWRG
jgi:hypothetical protein